MEDADFSSELAASFLNWDENEEEMEVTASPAPAAAAETATDNNANSSLSTAPSPSDIPGMLPQLQSLDVALASSTTMAAAAAAAATAKTSANAVAVQGILHPFQAQQHQQQALQQQMLHGNMQSALAQVNALQGNTSTQAYTITPQHHMLHGQATTASTTIQHQLHGNTTNNNNTSTSSSSTTAPVPASQAPAAQVVNGQPQQNGSGPQQQQQQQQQRTSPIPPLSSTTTPRIAAAAEATTANPTLQTLKAPQLHPLGIQSSANCPPHVTGTLPMVSLQNPTTSYMPLLYNPLLTSTTTTTPTATTAATATTTAPHLLGLTGTPAAATTAKAQHGAGPTAPTTTTAAAAATSVPTAASMQQQQQQPVPSTKPPAKTTKRKKRGKSSSQQPQQQQQQQQVPPFYLFDAPVELRTNFMQSQRLQNIPITQDNNAFHYGMAVNGFHPQVNAQVNPVLPPVSSSSAPSPLPPSMVQLIDARGKKKSKTGKERNEREQKRAQKITELIEKLRVSMENGGWKVEVKSKYHTLSTCADYVKHLMKTNREKEEAVEKARSDLEMKERKLEEEKANEARSDPESVTSSLTASTARSGKNFDEERDRKRKRDMSSSSSSSSSKDDHHNSSNNDNNDDDDDNNNNNNNKKPKASSSGSSDSSSEEQGSNGVAQNISLDKTASSVSDITDSNKGSSGSSGSISSTAAVARGTASRDRAEAHADIIIRVSRHSNKNPQKGKECKSHQHHQQQQRDKELTSMDTNFDLDFEEVFLMSNVPQLIATPAGRIIACNDFFLKATGLSRTDTQRLTIFSMVRADKLSNLFEMVAEALRCSSGEETLQNKDTTKQKSSNSSSSNNNSNNNNCTTSSNETGSSSSSSGHTTGASGNSSGDQEDHNAPRKWDYATMTLPCVTFPSRNKPSSSHHPNPLYMTVTLMKDEDPRKQCFHCVLTDCEGTNGSMGFITPELLRMLFSETIYSGLEGLNDNIQGKAKAPVETDDEAEMVGDADMDLDDGDDAGLDD